jgi:hypothetical protein
MANELIHVIVQYRNDRLSARAAEYDECVRRNLANPWVRRVHNLCEPGTVMLEEFRNHPKYTEKNLDHWLTYRDAFDYANAHLLGEMVCLCNLDIFLDAEKTDWQIASNMISQKMVLCLARWEWNGGAPSLDPGFIVKAMANTQDAWFFRAPVNVPDCEFEIGMLGCDNAIAERIKRAGFFPINAPQTFHIFHVDKVRGKTSANHIDVHRQETAIRPPNRHPERSGQWLVPDYDQIKSLDEVAKALNLNPLQKYAAICELLNKCQVHNPD